MYVRISARIENSGSAHKVSLKTNEQEQLLAIPPSPGGFASSVNGGEHLFLALATCYCNDIDLEARKRGIKIRGVVVEVRSEFGGEGHYLPGVRGS